MFTKLMAFGLLIFVLKYYNSIIEISEYAHQLGIDPDSESHLLPLAKEGLMQALPAPWKA